MFLSFILNSKLYNKCNLKNLAIGNELTLMEKKFTFGIRLTLNLTLI